MAAGDCTGDGLSARPFPRAALISPAKGEERCDAIPRNLQAKWGFCFVQGVPPTAAATEALAQRATFIRPTIFGASAPSLLPPPPPRATIIARTPPNSWGSQRLAPLPLAVFLTAGGFWDFQPNLEHADTAYTTLALGCHTDTTYFTDPIGSVTAAAWRVRGRTTAALAAARSHHTTPRSGCGAHMLASLQMFHLIEFRGEGGQTLLVDAFRVAEEMRQHHRDDYDTLCRVPVPSQYLDRVRCTRRLSRLGPPRHTHIHTHTRPKPLTPRRRVPVHAPRPAA